MTEKKKGDFGQWQRTDKGGHKKAHDKPESASRTRDKETVTSGERNVGG